MLILKNENGNFLQHDDFAKNIQLPCADKDYSIMTSGITTSVTTKIKDVFRNITGTKEKIYFISPFSQVQRSTFQDNEINPTNKFLRLKFNFDVNNCLFCENDKENFDYLFLNVSILSE